MTTESPTDRFAVCFTPSVSAAHDLKVWPYDDPLWLLRDLFEDARETDRTVKEGPALIFAQPSPPLEGGLYVGRGGVPTDQPYRCKENFGAATALVLDYDGETVDDLEAALVKLRARGLAFVTWPTFSYGTAKDPFRYRLAFGLSKPIPASAWKTAWPALLQHLELDQLEGIDHACKDIGREFFLPAWNPANAIERPAPELHEGAPIDVEAVLGNVTSAAPAPRPVATFTDGTSRADLARVRARLEELCNEPQDRELLEAAKAGEILKLNGARHEAFMRITSILARAAEPTDSSESLLEVIAPSIEALERMEPGRGARHEALDLLHRSRAHWAKKEAEGEAMIARIRATLPPRPPLPPKEEWPVMKHYTSSTYFIRKWDGQTMDLTRPLKATQATDHLKATQDPERLKDLMGPREGLGGELEIEGICFSVRELGSFPGQPPIVDLAPDCRAYNTWVPPTLKVEQGDWPRVRRVLSWLVDHDPAGLEWLLNWIAFKVQKPGEMPCTAILLQGPQGTGKNVLFRVLARVLGEENCAQIGERDVGKEFNSHYATALLVFVNELAKDGARDIDLGNAFKAQITDKRDWIEGKGKDRLFFDNRKAFIAATNHAKPIALEAEDRRWSIFHNATPATVRLADGTTHREFLAGLHVHGVNEKFTDDFDREIGAFAFDMLKRQVDHRLVRTPYENAARERLKQASESLIDQFMRELTELVSDDAREKRLDALTRSAENRNLLSRARSEEKLRGKGARSLEALHGAFTAFCRELAARPEHVPGSRALATALRDAGWTDVKTEGPRGWVAPWTKAKEGKS